MTAKIVIALAGLVLAATGMASAAQARPHHHHQCHMERHHHHMVRVCRSW